MGEAMSNEFDDFMADFVGASDIGLINARTAMAFALLENGAQNPAPAKNPADTDRSEEWKLELKCYEGEELAASASLWKLAGRYLRNVGQEEAKKMVELEAKEFGVEIPPAALEKKGDGDLDSLGYLNLAGVGE